MAEGGEVLGGAAGVEVELGLEVSDGSFAVAEEFEHADSHRMAEHPEELRFDDVDGIGAHVCCAGVGWRWYGCGGAAARGHDLRSVDDAPALRPCVLAWVERQRRYTLVVAHRSETLKFEDPDASDRVLSRAVTSLTFRCLLSRHGLAVL